MRSTLLLSHLVTLWNLFPCTCTASTTLMLSCSFTTGLVILFQNTYSLRYPTTGLCLMNTSLRHQSAQCLNSITTLFICRRIDQQRTIIDLKLSKQLILDHITPSDRVFLVNLTCVGDLWTAKDAEMPIHGKSRTSF